MSIDLRRFERFDDLPDADLGILERVMVVQKHPDGHVLIREGDVATAGTSVTWLLLEGEVQVEAAAPEGGWGVKRKVGPGQFIGLLALVANVRRSATCRASGPVVAAKLDRRTMEELMKRDAGVHVRFQMLVARHLTEDLRALTARVAAVATER